MWEIKRPVKYVCGAGTSLMHSIVQATNGGQRNALRTIQKWEENLLDIDWSKCGFFTYYQLIQ